MYGMKRHIDAAAACYAARDQSEERAQHRRQNQRSRTVRGQRLIDLSYTAALKLDMLKEGTTRGGEALTVRNPTISLAQPRHHRCAVCSVGAFADQTNAQRVLDRLHTAACRVPSPGAARWQPPLYRVRWADQQCPEFDQLAPG